MRALSIALIIAIWAGGCRLNYDGTLCGEVDLNTLALFTMDNLGGGVAADSTGTHPAMIRGDGFTGAGDCGDAFSSGGGAVIVVPHSPEWDLAVGSVDFRAIIPGGEDEQGMVSRDALGTDDPGHLTVFLSRERQIIVRLQTTDGGGFRCSRAIEPGTSVHVTVNFGSPGLELRIDGEVASEPQANLGRSSISCTGDPRAGIVGNEEPWVIGADGSNSSRGQATPLNGQFTGVIDEVRISRVHRRF